MIVGSGKDSIQERKEHWDVWLSVVVFFFLFAGLGLIGVGAAVRFALLELGFSGFRASNKFLSSPA